MEKPSVAEAGLMEEPVQALRARLSQLLEDWPEHPILSQLLILCDRLLGARLVPLRLPSDLCMFLPRVSRVLALKSSLPSTELVWCSDNNGSHGKQRVCSS